MCRSSVVDKTPLPTPNTSAQFNLGSANVQQNVTDDGATMTVHDKRESMAYKSDGNASENDASSRTNAIENREQNSGGDRNYFGSMVSVNENFDLDAVLKK